MRMRHQHPNNISHKSNITMPPRKNMKKKRATKPKTAYKKKKSSTNVGEYASLSVKNSLTDPQGNPFVVNKMYDVHNIRMADYPRAVQVANAYQFFRIKKVAITYKIGYDTYQATAGGPTRPQFYYMLDKSQSIPVNVSLEGLKQMGARPSACDEKPIVRQWAPAVLTEQQSLAGPVGAKYVISPWLNTNQNNLGIFNPSTVNHNGLYWYVQMDQTATVQYQYTVEIEVQFEFKKPLWTGSLSATPSLGVKPAIQDDSPDGIVGGADTPGHILT